MIEDLIPIPSARMLIFAHQVALEHGAELAQTLDTIEANRAHLREVLTDTVEILRHVEATPNTKQLLVNAIFRLSKLVDRPSVENS